MPQTKREGFVQEDDEPVRPAPKVVEAKVEPPPPPVPEPEEAGIFVTKWPMRIKLMHRPIRDEKNQEISVISFREPTGSDINRYGAPVRLSADGQFDIDDRKMAAMMSALSGHLLPILERMDPRDWQSCAYRLRLYFQPDTSGWI
jgi:hypothetical protein